MGECGLTWVKLDEGKCGLTWVGADEKEYGVTLMGADEEECGLTWVGGDEWEYGLTLVSCYEVSSVSTHFSRVLFAKAKCKVALRRKKDNFLLPAFIFYHRFFYVVVSVNEFSSFRTMRLIQQMYHTKYNTPTQEGLIFSVINILHSAGFFKTVKNGISNTDEHFTV